MQVRYVKLLRHLVAYGLAAFFGPLAASAALLTLAAIFSALIPAVGLAAFLVVIGSLVMGTEFYTLFGLPAFAVFILLGARNPLWFLVAGLAAHAISLPLLPDIIGPTATVRPDAGIRTISTWGWVFAPIWGLGFGLIYWGLAAPGGGPK